MSVLYEPRQFSLSAKINVQVSYMYMQNDIKQLLSIIQTPNSNKIT